MRVVSFVKSSETVLDVLESIRDGECGTIKSVLERAGASWKLSNLTNGKGSSSSEQVFDDIVLQSRPVHRRPRQPAGQNERYERGIEH